MELWWWLLIGGPRAGYFAGHALPASCPALPMPRCKSAPNSPPSFPLPLPRGEGESSSVPSSSPHSVRRPSVGVPWNAVSVSVFAAVSECPPLQSQVRPALSPVPSQVWLASHSAGAATCKQRASSEDRAAAQRQHSTAQHSTTSQRSLLSLSLHFISTSHNTTASLCIAVSYHTYRSCRSLPDRLLSRSRRVRLPPPLLTPLTSYLTSPHFSPNCVWSASNSPTTFPSTRHFPPFLRHFAPLAIHYSLGLAGGRYFRPPGRSSRDWIAGRQAGRQASLGPPDAQTLLTLMDKVDA